MGSAFKSIHEYLETLYDGMADVLDEVAELLKMHEAQPLASLKEYLEAASIHELDSAERRSGEALALVEADLQTLKAQAEEIRAAADSEGFYDAAAMMEDHLADYNKTLWFIRSMRK